MKKEGDVKSWAGVEDDAVEMTAKKSSGKLRKVLVGVIVGGFALVGMSIAMAPPETSTKAAGEPAVEGSAVSQVCDLARSSLKALRTGAQVDSAALVAATEDAISSSEGYSATMLKELDRVHDAARDGGALGFAVRDLVAECRS